MSGGGFAYANARRGDLIANDLHPTCPRCAALCTGGAKWCGECDTWLLDRGPTAPELAERQRARRQAKTWAKPKRSPDPPPPTRPPLHEGRFVVRTVSGYRIFTSGEGGAWGTDYSVHDSANGYAVVKSWPAGAGSRTSDRSRRERAERHAERLNAAHAGEDTQPTKGTEA